MTAHSAVVLSEVQQGQARLHASQTRLLKRLACRCCIVHTVAIKDALLVRRRPLQVARAKNVLDRVAAFVLPVELRLADDWAVAEHVAALDGAVGGGG